MRITLYSLAILLWAICVACINPASSQTKPASSESIALPIPAGWVAYRAPAADSAILQCAANSRREWRVEAADKGAVEIRLDRREEHRAALPPAINLRGAAIGAKGSRSIEQVDDGWLIGFDAGEFGGGLWWFASDGKSRKRLASDNITGFARTANGVYAVTGLAHMGFESGKVLQIGAGAAGNRQIKTLVDLGFAPQTFAVESDDSLLILTTRALIRVKTAGATERLLTVNFGRLYPNSMVILPSNVIYAGMRHFVVRLTPIENGYKEEWFVPNDCTRFKEQNYDCVCLPKGK